MDTTSIFQIITKDPLTLFGVLAVIVLKLLLDYFKSKASSDRVKEAEQKAFDIDPKEIQKDLASLIEEKDSLKEDAEKVRSLIEESRGALILGRLSNLYNKQIEKYQQETRTRASWSFIFAIVSMFLGMGFVFWGGSFILRDSGAGHVTAGAAISAIGGGISAYITKTFLSVHKLSITQLNRYFKQPVINDHILMAQRLADDIGNQDFRIDSYKKIIDSITTLINSERSVEPIQVEKEIEKSS